MDPADLAPLPPDRLDAYLNRLGRVATDRAPDLDLLTELHLAHLERVPFENLDIVFADGAVHDQSAAEDKIVRRGRGGWCFELNGAFARLLVSLGFEVRLLGAAVLLGGPSTVIDHLLLEVSSPDLAPHLADVGFGDSFDLPLALNTPGPQAGGSGTFELIGSPQGTTLTRHVDGVPAATMRFKRVAHDFADFAPAAASLQADDTAHWSAKPFATRRLTDHELDARWTPEQLDGHPRRVTLTHDRVKVEQAGDTEETPVDRDGWDRVLEERFAMTRPGRWSEVSSAND